MHWLCFGVRVGLSNSLHDSSVSCQITSATTSSPQGVGEKRPGHGGPRGHRQEVCAQSHLRTTIRVSGDSEGSFRPHWLLLAFTMYQIPCSSPGKQPVLIAPEIPEGWEAGRGRDLTPVGG